MVDSDCESLTIPKVENTNNTLQKLRIWFNVTEALNFHTDSLEHCLSCKTLDFKFRYNSRDFVHLSAKSHDVFKNLHKLKLFEISGFF